METKAETEEKTKTVQQTAVVSSALRQLLSALGQLCAVIAEFESAEALMLREKHNRLRRCERKRTSLTHPPAPFTESDGSGVKWRSCEFAELATGGIRSGQGLECVMCGKGRHPECNRENENRPQRSGGSNRRRSPLTLVVSGNRLRAEPDAGRDSVQEAGGMVSVRKAHCE